MNVTIRRADETDLQAVSQLAMKLVRQHQSYINFGGQKKMRMVLSLFSSLALCVPMAFAQGNNSHFENKQNAKFSIKVEPDEPGFTVTKIGDGVYAAIGGADDPAESNAGFIIGNNGVVIVDTFEDVAAARDLLKAIRQITDLPTSKPSTGTARNTSRRVTPSKKFVS